MLLKLPTYSSCWEAWLLRWASALYFRQRLLMDSHTNSDSSGHRRPDRQSMPESGRLPHDGQPCVTSLFPNWTDYSPQQSRRTTRFKWTRILSARSMTALPGRFGFSCGARRAMRSLRTISCKRHTIDSSGREPHLKAKRIDEIISFASQPIWSTTDCATRSMRWGCLKETNPLASPWIRIPQRVASGGQTSSVRCSDSNHGNGTHYGSPTRKARLTKRLPGFWD